MTKIKKEIDVERLPLATIESYLRLSGIETYGKSRKEMKKILIDLTKKQTQQDKDAIIRHLKKDKLRLAWQNNINIKKSNGKNLTWKEKIELKIKLNVKDLEDIRSAFEQAGQEKLWDSKARETIDDAIKDGYKIKKTGEY